MLDKPREALHKRLFCTWHNKWWELKKRNTEGQSANALANKHHSPSFFYPFPSSAQDYCVPFLHSPSEPFSPVLICYPSLTPMLPVFYPLCPHNLSVAPPLFPSFCIGVLISLVPHQNSLETVCRMTVGNGGIIQRIFKDLKCLFWLLLIAQDAITINIQAAKTGSGASGIKINI